MFSGVFIAEDFGGVADRVLGDTTMVDMHSVLWTFLNMSPRSTCFIDKTFFW